MTRSRIRQTAWLLTAVLAIAAAAGAAGTVSAQAAADSTRQRSVNPADVHFMSGMIGHHAQAIVMARMAPTHGASDALQRLAARVINAQQDEIAIMQQWLRDRGQPVPQVDSTGSVAGHMAGHHQHQMPGMLTEAEMKQLDAARGAEFDRLFLTLMIKHHQGAVEMVKRLTDSQGAALDETVFKVASDIHVDQMTEISRMQKMLFELLIQKSSQ
jgi:uncharacterized protein (DUF305 family)